jgi:hypothetical protein
MTDNITKQIKRKIFNPKIIINIISYNLRLIKQASLAKNLNYVNL